MIQFCRQGRRQLQRGTQSGAQNGNLARLLELRGDYFFTISAFSSIATPPRSATLPLSVTVLPQYSAS
jgi:hypothetical protein